MRVKFLTVLSLALVLFAGACGKKDADIQKAAQDKLAADGVAGVTVAVKDGVATLTGQVKDITVKNKAAASAKVEGVKSVNVQITLAPLPTPEPPSSDKMLEGVINQGLSKASITGVTVAASGGEVTLTGTVAKDKLAQVMQIANEAKPSKVNNKLTVK